MPLSPTAIGDQERSFGVGHSFGSNIQLTDSPLYSAISGVSHSPSSFNLGQIQFDKNGWSPHRSQMRLQSRRSASRDDLISSLSDH